MTLSTRVLVAGAVLLAAATAAPAHSLLLESSPAAGADLARPPERVALRFNNRIEKRLCRVRLVDERGESRALVVAEREGAPDALTAALPPLGPGAYRVEWRVLSTDGHVVNGRFAFRVTR